MATNALLRQGSSNEQFVYRYTQPNSNFGSDSSIESLVSGVSGYNNSFVSSAGWRMLNLRLPSNLPSDYIGKLEFSMGTSGDVVLSAACGFTLGIPPLYATHINTITKSIVYGFICNPFNTTNNQNRLWIVHENTLTQLGTEHTPSSTLSIEIKNGVATYQVGSTIVFASAIQTSMPLYVVGVCGFNNNTITNIGLEGGSGFTVPSIDYSKEIWILCNGLTSQAQRFDGIALSGDYATGVASRLSRVELLTNLEKNYTITFPNENIENVNTITSNNWRTISSQNFAALPIVIRIAFSSLTDLLGIRIVNPSIGTETSIFNSTSIQNLNNLQELEIRSVDDLVSPSVSAIRQFKPAIGQLPLPLQSLKTLFVEGCFDIPTTIANIPKCLNLETVIYYLTNTNKPNFSALRNLKTFIFNTTTSPTNIRFSGFRELFNPNRVITTHKLITASLNETQYLDLALAQISSSLLWGETIRTDSDSYIPTSGVTGGYSFNGSNAAHVGSASSLQDGGNLPNSTLAFSGDSVTITIAGGAPNGNINNTIANHFQNGSPICFKKQTLTNQQFTDAHSNIQLRRISNYSGDTLSKTVSGNNLVISFKLIPIKTRSTFTNVTITANTTYLAGTTTSFFTISNISTTNLLIGDTVRLSTATPSFSSRSNTPSIIVEIIDANSVVVSKGNVSDGIAAGISSVVVNYEFPPENSYSPLTNSTEYTANPQNTIIRTNGSPVSIVALLAFFRNGVPGS